MEALKAEAREERFPLLLLFPLFSCSNIFAHTYVHIHEEIGGHFRENLRQACLLLHLKGPQIIAAFYVFCMYYSTIEKLLTNKKRNIFCS